MASYTKLTQGSRGEAVRRLQTRLNGHGAKLTVDGVFGPKTAAAVKQYQKANALAVDGVVGQATWRSLLAAPAAPTAPAPAAPAAPTAPTAGVTGPAAPAAPAANGGVSAATARALAAYEGDYAPGLAVTQALEALRRAEEQRPGDYVSPYAAAAEELERQRVARRPFAYDVSADPLYRQYQEQYMRQGRAAMDDTTGRASALTGGYGSSYARQAGWQMYDRYLQELNSKVPALYEQAYRRYRDEGEDLDRRAKALQQSEALAYERWRDAMGDWQSRVKERRGEYEQLRQEDYKSWSDRRKFWQDRARSEEEAWRQDRQWADKQALEQRKLAQGQAQWEQKQALEQSKLAQGRAQWEQKQALEQSKLALRSRRTAGGGGKSAAKGQGGQKGGEIMVHVPDYGTIPLSRAREMVNTGHLQWVMKDDRKTHMTDREGNYLARLRKAPPRTATAAKR